MTGLYWGIGDKMVGLYWGKGDKKGRAILGWGRGVQW